MTRPRLLPLFLWVAFGPPLSGHAAGAGATPKMIPVDTSGLMGTPDPILPYDFEPAFPRLEFKRPVAITHAPDGTGRLFVVEQDGTIRVFPNRRDVRPDQCQTFLDLRAVVSRAD